MLLFQEFHGPIDWSRHHESLDKEFQQVVREAEVGRRYVDKLVKVWRKEEVECWVLIHVEVQTTHEAEFPQRRCVYNYRIFDRYHKPVARLAVLAADPNWRPQEFHSRLFGCKVGIHFPVTKLLDFAAHEAVLEASANPFSAVILAHRQVQQTRGNPGDWHAWKLRLIRGLYERGFSSKDVRELFRILDWSMELPFITSIERLALHRGMRRGIKGLLRLRFAEEGLKLMPEIEEIDEEEQLEAILQALESGLSLDEVRRLCSPGTPKGE